MSTTDTASTHQTAISCVWGPHYPPLRGIADIGTSPTATLRRIRLRLTETARDRTVLVVTGSAGSGKSFGVGRGAEHVVTKLGHQVIWVELASSASEKALLEDLYIQVTGTEPPSRSRAADLRRHLQRVLSEQPRVLIVDEAQHASSMALRNLRWLHDKSTSDFALVIVGTPTLWKTLPPEMRSRTAYHVEVDRIADGDAAKTLTGLHPFFTNVPRGLLADLNRQYARGSFRWWAKFLANAVNLEATAGPLTTDTLWLYVADLDGA